jgi:hypothetical protein
MVKWLKRKLVTRIFKLIEDAQTEHIDHIGDANSPDIFDRVITHGSIFNIKLRDGQSIVIRKYSMFRIGE